MSAKSHKKPSLRKERMIQDILAGEVPAQAAKKHGYSKAYQRCNVYREIAKDSVQEKIRQRIKEAEVDSKEVVGTLVSHMRGDLAEIIPDDEFLQKAKERGVSHLIKDLKLTRRTIPGEVDEEGNEISPAVLETKYEIKIHDSQAAAKQLCGVLGLEKMPGVNPTDIEEAKRLLDWHRLNSQDFTEQQIYILLIKPLFPAITAEVLQIKGGG